MDALSLDVVGGHALAIQGNVLISVHRNPVTAEVVEQDYAAAKKLLQAHRTGIGQFVVLEADAAAPDAGAQAVLARWSSDEEATVRARVVVHMASGFPAAQLRAIALTLSRDGRLEHPDHVCEGIAEAVAWLTSELTERGAPCPMAPELLHAVRELRKRLAPPSTAKLEVERG